MKVIIVCKTSDDGQDLLFRIIIPATGRISRIFRLRGKADTWNMSPYLVYGPDIATYTGCEQFDCSISVARCHSGDL